MAVCADLIRFLVHYQPQLRLFLSGRLFRNFRIPCEETILMGGYIYIIHIEVRKTVHSLEFQNNPAAPGHRGKLYFLPVFIMPGKTAFSKNRHIERHGNGTDASVLIVLHFPFSVQADHRLLYSGTPHGFRRQAGNHRFLPVTHRFYRSVLYLFGVHFHSPFSPPERSLIRKVSFLPGTSSAAGRI